MTKKEGLLKVADNDGYYYVVDGYNKILKCNFGSMTMTGQCVQFLHKDGSINVNLCDLETRVYDTELDACLYVFKMKKRALSDRVSIIDREISERRKKLIELENELKNLEMEHNETVSKLS